MSASDYEAIAASSIRTASFRPRKLFGTDLTAGGIGCALSHMLLGRNVHVSLVRLPGMLLMMQDIFRLIWRDIIQKCAEGFVLKSVLGDTYAARACGWPKPLACCCR